MRKRMRKKKFLSFFIFLFSSLPFITFGQDNGKILIEGTVVEADSLQPLPYVHVKEKSANVGTVTGADGQFTVSVNTRDTIVFSIIGYHSYSLVPADTTPQSLGQIIIKMVPRIYVLKEVKVKDYRDLTKYLQPKIDSTVDLRRPEKYPLV